MTGSFVKISSNFRIREIRTVEVKNLGYGNTCIMNYDLVYTKSGKEEFLEGTYLGKPEVKTKENPYEWGDCGGGKVFLRKVVTSDFYVEPFLRKNNPVTKSTPVKPPVTNKPVTLTPPPVVKNKPVVKPNITKPKEDPIRKTDVGPKVSDSAFAKKPEIKKETPSIKLPGITSDVLKNRQNELMKSLVVHDPDVIVKLYDNGEIDDDTISVYLDKKLVLSSKKLTASPLILRLKMDPENPNHELIMVAENLGRIPPNTSLMVVEAGEQRFDVRITSTEQKNAVVRFRYEKKE